MKHLTFAFLFFLLTASTISGQTRTLSGRVTDLAGEPLPGVTVRLKNTPTGGATDAGDSRAGLPTFSGTKTSNSAPFFSSKPATRFICSTAWPGGQ